METLYDIFVGAIGSLVATIIVFYFRKFIDRKKKTTLESSLAKIPSSRVISLVIIAIMVFVYIAIIYEAIPEYIEYQLQRYQDVDGWVFWILIILTILALPIVILGPISFFLWVYWYLDEYGVPWGLYFLLPKKFSKPPSKTDYQGYWFMALLSLGLLIYVAWALISREYYQITI